MKQILAKLNWACTNCGMSSSRRYNVERHIENKHQGYSQVVRFTEYIVGRCGGIYNIPLEIPRARPLYEKSEKASTSDGDRNFWEMIKACNEMVHANQGVTYATYPTSTFHQEASQLQPADSDKTMATDDKDPSLEAAKKMVDLCMVAKVKDPSLEAAKKKFEQLLINNVNGAAENPLNSLKTSNSHEIDFREIARKAVDNVYAAMEKNAGAHFPGHDRGHYR